MVRLTGFLGACLVLAACSSGGGSSSGSGSSSSGSSAVDDATDLSVAVIETTRSVINAQFAPDFDFLGGGLGPQAQSERSQMLSGLPVGARETNTQTEDGPCGGSMTMTTVTDMPDEPGVIYPISIDMDIDYNNFCYEDGYRVNGGGDVSMSYGAEGSLSYDFDIDMSVTGGILGSDSYEYRYAQSCDTVDGVLDCTDAISYESDFSDLTFELTEYSLDGGDGTPYEVDGSFVVDGESYVLNATGLTLCDNGNFGTGTIELTVDGADYLTIEFTSCSDYAYVYEGVSGTGTH